VLQFFFLNLRMLAEKCAPFITACHVGNRRRKLSSVTTPQKESNPEATSRQNHPAPPWALMLAVIFLAILIAIGFAWLFIHPLLHPH
jgi:hypothetical protein